MESAWLKIDEICDGYVSWENLNDYQSMLVDFYIFSLEVNNGGIRQYLDNTSGSGTMSVARFISLVEHETTERLLESIISVFPKGEVPQSRVDRCYILEQLSEKIPTLFEQETADFYRIEESLYSRVLDFVSSNRKLFL